MSTGWLSSQKEKTEPITFQNHLKNTNKHPFSKIILN